MTTLEDKAENREPVPIGEGGLLNLQQAAQLLGLHRRTVVRYLQRGDLEGRIIGGRWRIRRSDLDLFYENAPRHWDWPERDGAEE